MLIGRKEITTFCGRSWAIVLYLVENENFPARMIKGVWQSNKQLIEHWTKEYILSGKPPRREGGNGELK